MATTVCAECGGVIPASFDGTCPRCLLALGSAAMSADSGGEDREDADAAAGFAPFQIGGYRAVRRLGGGGMGEVFEAEEVATGRRVALKMLKRAIASAETRKRFLREGRLAATITHPNSVYIFGTGEIEGTPVIVMELVEGGSLKEEVASHGPLPVAAAVDAILQVIAGLEAAVAAGVLHRDVKPANCFRAPDGVVKVGDFGLSISMVAPAESQLTTAGLVLGTLAYAAPEQLRGEEVDVRADLYSVGATLYTLLAGQPPFAHEHAVSVIAAVLDAPPPPLRQFRRDLPSGLTAVVARCLAKKREERPSDYASLRAALLPFCSAAPRPAPLALRFLADFVDELFAWLPARLVEAFFIGDLVGHFLEHRTLASFAPQIPVFLLYVAYFAVCEGLWGAGCGKALCGIRVVGPDRSAPGIPRASIRAFWWLLPFFVCEAAAFWMISQAEWAAMRASGQNTPMLFGFSFVGVCALVSFLLFVTARRRNGFAAIQDLMSKTRVVMRASAAATRRRDPAPPLPSAPGDHRVGPYRVRAVASAHPMVAGYDDLLGRHVWVRQWPGGAPPVPAARRGIQRATRLRWLGGARSEHAGWDAYEAPPGEALLAVARPSQPWAEVRQWLLDLAVELECATREGVLPVEVTIGNVWVSPGGGAILLDEPWAGEHGKSSDIGQPRGAQHFLHAVARATVDPVTLPLHARDFLARLGDGAFADAESVARELRSLVGKPAVLSRGRRAASLLATPACFLLLWYPGSLSHPDASAGAEAAIPHYYGAILRWLPVSIALFQLLSLLLFPVTPGQRAWSLAVVDGEGRPAGRMRMLCRWFIGWWLVAVVEGFFWMGLPPAGGPRAPIVFVASVGLLWIAGLVAAMERPARGPHDLLAGTRLVPR